MPDANRNAVSPKPRSHVVQAVIWGVALWYVLRLSAPGRGPVDWVVIGAVSAAIAWQLWKLGVRLRAAHGPGADWHEARTLLFWAVGLMNTVLAVPGSEGTWKWWVGVVLLVGAAADTVALYLKERKAVQPRAGA